MSKNIAIENRKIAQNLKEKEKPLHKINEIVKIQKPLYSKEDHWKLR